MAMNEVTSIDVKTLPPFKRLIMTLGELPTSYLESMTYAELLMWFCNFLQEKVLPTINNNADALQEVITYLENLDLQDEVNNKLDEMVEDGVLDQIIEQYLNSSAIWGFDNVQEMKEATNLINGSYAKTLGYSLINDGGSALYKIRELDNSDVVDEKLIIALSDTNLVAELVNTKNNNIKIFNDDIITAIKNSDILYLNNTTYNITVNEAITKTNIHIIGNGATINSSSNTTYIYNLNNAIIENVNFIESNITDKTKNFLFTGSNITFKNCYLESTVGFEGEINNITFDNCELKNWYRDIHQGSGKLNNLNVINCNFSKVQDYSTPYQADTKILIYNFNGTTNQLNESMLALHGNNVVIKNCTFEPCNKRQLHIFNCKNVIIENNTFKASGLDSAVIGGSDDLVSIDFVDYFKINNNYFGVSGENGFDILSSHYGEVFNNTLSKVYDQYEIDINWSDYIRTYGENLTNRELIKSSDIMIKNNTIDSNQYTIFITPSNNIHIYENNITNNVSSTILLFSDYGTLSSSNPSNLKISHLDVGSNNVKTSLGNFGRASVRTGYNYVIDENSGHLSKDICCYETQEVTANTQVFCTCNFPCVNGEAGKLISLDGSFRSVTPALVRWQNSQSTRRGIDFIGNRYNSPYWGTLFYTGDYLDKYPLGQTGDANASYDGTQTSGTIAFKSW